MHIYFTLSEWVYITSDQVALRIFINFYLNWVGLTVGVSITCLNKPKFESVYCVYIYSYINLAPNLHDK